MKKTGDLSVFFIKFFQKSQDGFTKGNAVPTPNKKENRTK